MRYGSLIVAALFVWLALVAAQIDDRAERLRPLRTLTARSISALFGGSDTVYLLNTGSTSLTFWVDDQLHVLGPGQRVELPRYHPGDSIIIRCQIPLLFNQQFRCAEIVAPTIES